MNPISKEAYALLHNGSIALAQAERKGIRIDVGYCKKMQKLLSKKEDEVRKKILSSKAGKYWKRQYGSMLKLGATEQLRDVLKAVYGIDHYGSLDKNHLAKVDIPIIDDILEYRKITKARSTYIQGILNEVIDGYLHPNFNLHLALTYRSSSSNPNFQNIPIRDPWVSKIIRRAFIPRPGHRIAEGDYSGIEVKVAACYHEDPRMLKYLRTGYDMHKEMAAEIYKTPQDNVSKLMRYTAKNRFVFPAFYGSYYKQMAPDLWNALTEFKLTQEDGTDLTSYLRKKGIHGYDDFESHIKEIEDKFWFKKFPVYAQWKKDWWIAYLKKGWFKTKTGFVCRGKMKRNECINYGIQGSAFHCLLWTFIEVTNQLNKLKMESALIGQIHDSIIADIPEAEYQDYLALLKETSTTKLREAWNWILLDMDIEVEATEPDGSWYTKKGVVI